MKPNSIFLPGSCLAVYFWIAIEVLLFCGSSDAIGQTPQEKTFERLVEDETTGNITLQFPVRRFQRKGETGPVVTTHAMVHIADRSFYEKHQSMLDPLDVVLFEMVLMPGTGRPEYSLQDTDSPEWKIATTKMRMRSLAAIASSYAVRQGKLPASFRDLLKLDPNLRAFADRLAKDAWGNEFEFSTKEPGPMLDITSWGEDNVAGGVGEAADILLSEQEPIPFGQMQPNSMHRMSQYLGLVFQGEVENHDRNNWRSCDLSDDQVSERLIKEGMPNEEKKNADAWLPVRVLETMSELSQAMPGLKNAGKVFFMDILGESPIQSQVAIPDAFSKVILDDRNQVVIDDLKAILDDEPNVRSVGIIYGAAHMPGIESQLIELGYEETNVEWIDAITVSLPQTPIERQQLDISRKTIRAMGLLGGTDTPGEGKRKRWRRSNTSEDALALNYRKELLREWIGELAKALDSDREAERDQAEKDLMRLGSFAIPYLPASSDDDSDELRIRLERIRGTLLALDKEKLATPSRVTLRGAMSGRQALESLAEQTGNALTLKDVAGLEKQVDVDMEDLLYWEALDEVLDMLALTIMPFDGDALQIVPRTEAFPQRFVMASYSGSFRIEPVAITKAQRLYEPDLNSTSIEIALSWEPRLNPVFVRYALEGLELKCDNGEVLRPKPNQGTDFTPTGSQLLSIIEFDRPSRSAKEIVEWKGEFLCAIPGKPVALSFKDLDTARNNSASKGDLKVTLERTRKNRDVYEVLLGIAVQGDQNTDSMQGWTALIDAYLEDASGKRMEHAGWSTTRITDQDVGLSFLFEVDDSLAGYRFVFVAPQSIMQQTIEYSLGGITLP
jgi:hypothetical protein